MIQNKFSYFIRNSYTFRVQFFKVHLILKICEPMGQNLKRHEPVISAAYNFLNEFYKSPIY